jgi:hypothetical protein
MSFAPHIAGYLPKKSDTTPVQRAEGKDRWGYTMEDRIAWQDRQLALLKPVLEPKVHAKLTAWCKRTNKAAAPEEVWPLGNHTVPCGCELFEWLLKHGELLNDME